MACRYVKDSTLNAELLNTRAQLVKCCACSLLRWGLRMYLSMLNIRSSSTGPGTIAITNSATLTHPPNRYCAPKRVASPQNSLAERGVGGGGCAGSGSLLDSSLLLAAAGLASSAAAAAAAAAACCSRVSILSCCLLLAAAAACCLLLLLLLAAACCSRVSILSCCCCCCCCSPCSPGSPGSLDQLFSSTPHHTANPYAGAVPRGLDAQATKLGTCLWAHGPLSTSHHFSPWHLWPFLVEVYRSFQHDH